MHDKNASMSAGKIKTRSAHSIGWNISDIERYLLQYVIVICMSFRVLLLTTVTHSTIFEYYRYHSIPWKVQWYPLYVWYKSAAIAVEACSEIQCGVVITRLIFFKASYWRQPVRAKYGVSVVSKNSFIFSPNLYNAVCNTALHLTVIW